MGADRAAIWRLFAGHRGALARGLVASVAQALVLLPIGLLVRHVFADSLPAHDKGEILALGAVILLLYVVSAGLSLLAARIILLATASATARLRTDVLRRLHELPLAWHHRHSAAELQSDIVAQAERVEAVAQPLVTLGQTLIVGPPLLVLAVTISPLLAGVVVVVVPLLIGVGIVMRRRLLPAVLSWHAAFKRYGAHVQLTLRTIALTRSRSADDLELVRGTAHVDALAGEALRKNWRQQTFGVTQGAVAAVAGSLILTVGGLAVVEGALELADLIAFYAVIGLLLRSLAGGSGASGALVTAIQSLRALQAIVDDPAVPPYPATGAPVPSVGAVALRDVTFGYGDEAVLHGVEIEIGPGEHVALTGPNGAGKSTIAALILGLYRPWSGTVTAGGTAYDELDVTALRRRIGYVPQEPTLRPDTVADNIAFGRPDADRAAIERAAELAGVDAFVDTLEDGYDTLVGDEGTRLSGGERQRVALARALVGSPELLILDEPTNHLDAESVAQLMVTLDRLDHAPAVIVVTHDARLADWTHRQISLDHGRVVAGLSAGRSRRRPGR